MSLLSTGARSQGAPGSHDSQAHFVQPLIYLAWDEHMMFAAPLVQSLSPTTTFLDLVQTVMPKLYGEHPQFQQIDWNKTQWFRGSVMFTPRMQGSLAEHGLSHKSVLRFRTPGLEGLRGSCG